MPLKVNFWDLSKDGKWFHRRHLVSAGEKRAATPHSAIVTFQKNLRIATRVVEQKNFPIFLGLSVLCRSVFGVDLCPTYVHFRDLSVPYGCPKGQFSGSIYGLKVNFWGISVPYRLILGGLSWPCGSVFWVYLGPKGQSFGGLPMPHR